MDHNLEDSLNLESAMGSMDFDHTGVVVNQADITLEASAHDEDMPMEFERIEEQPILMDTGNEEIIVSDFMNDQYTLQEYSVQEAPSPEVSETVEQLNVLTSQSESIMNLKFDSEASVSQEVTTQPQYITVKTALGSIRPNSKKNEPSAITSMPRQVAIAPKPPKPTKYGAGKQFAIAPKPVVMVNKAPGSNKVLTGVIQSNTKRTVLTQIGKQLVMLPAGAQKIKLVSSNSGTLQYVRTSSDQTQVVSTKTVSGSSTQKPLIAKVIMQGASQNLDSNQPAVITKLLSGSSSAPQAHYVMQQKTVPISIGSNKLLLTSPSKSGMKIGKKQIIAIKSPTPKLMPMTSQAGTTKKIVISTNPNQNVILKTTAPSKSGQVTRDGNVVVQSQRSQLHQINVPGKGIQYIRLITNSSPAPLKVTPKTQMPALAVPSKGFVLTDNKGNLIQMSADKLTSGQPPPLVITGSIATKMTTKPQKKLVRIAPVTAKPVQPAMQQQNSRSAQSLLAPLSPTAEDRVEEDSLDRVSMSQEGVDLVADEALEASDHDDDVEAKVEEPVAYDDAVADDTAHGIHEVEVSFERHESPVNEEGNSMEHHNTSDRSEEHPLIVIPTNFIKQESQVRVTSESSHTTTYHTDESQNYSNIETDMTPYLSPKQSQPASENDLMSGELGGLRPRRACNCTKSQCLKLYCDCFANGEFCNQCNCNNCHNNLENEELRQKAIRACLDRNPNAFRPKIGKSKSTGPVIIRRHNKGCNCKRSGCLKNYCECYEAKIACTGMCKCVGCRNVEDTLERRAALRRPHAAALAPAPTAHHALPRQPCSFMTSEVIEAVCQCLIAAAVEGGEGAPALEKASVDPVRDVIDEFARCLQDIISASRHSTALPVLDEGQA